MFLAVPAPAELPARHREGLLDTVLAAVNPAQPQPCPCHPPVLPGWAWREPWAGADLVTLLHCCLTPAQQAGGCTALRGMVELIHLYISSDFCQIEVAMEAASLGSWL